MFWFFVMDYLARFGLHLCEYFYFVLVILEALSSCGAYLQYSGRQCSPWNIGQTNKFDSDMTFDVTTL